MTDSLRELSETLARFARERDWGQFHSPKNLAAALTVEAAELLEHFQWMTEDESRHLAEARKAAVASEIADVLLYLVQISTVLGIDPVLAANAKVQLNEQRFPADAVRGSSAQSIERRS
jgi:NTP pyrophosphatase (non-canonical NTP hydrolase)